MPGRRRRFGDRILEVVHVGEAGHAGPDHLGAAEPRAEPDEVGADELALDRHHVAHQPDVEPQIVGQPAQQRHRHVRVRVDQPRHHHAAAAIDGLGGRVARARRARRRRCCRPRSATAPGRCTVNCGSIVRTVALVRRRSQLAGMTADYHRDSFDVEAESRSGHRREPERGDQREHRAADRHRIDLSYWR